MYSWIFFLRRQPKSTNTFNVCSKTCRGAFSCRWLVCGGTCEGSGEIRSCRSLGTQWPLQGFQKKCGHENSSRCPRCRTCFWNCGRAQAAEQLEIQIGLVAMVASCNRFRVPFACNDGNLLQSWGNLRATRCHTGHGWIRRPASVSCGSCLFVVVLSVLCFVVV